MSVSTWQEGTWKSSFSKVLITKSIIPKTFRFRVYCWEDSTTIHYYWFKRMIPGCAKCSWGIGFNHESYQNFFGLTGSFHQHLSLKVLLFLNSFDSLYPRQFFFFSQMYQANCNGTIICFHSQKTLSLKKVTSSHFHPCLSSVSSCFHSMSVTNWNSHI